MREPRAVRDLVLLQETGEALYFALIRGRQEDASFLLDERVEIVDERWNGAVGSAWSGRVAKSDFGEVAAVGVEDIDCAELV